MKPPASPCASFSELNWLGKSNALGLCAAMLGLTSATRKPHPISRRRTAVWPKPCRRWPSMPWW